MTDTREDLLDGLEPAFTNERRLQLAQEICDDLCDGVDVAVESGVDFGISTDKLKAHIRTRVLRRMGTMRVRWLYDDHGPEISRRLPPAQPRSTFTRI